jgi:hypothetical protein
MSEGKRVYVLTKFRKDDIFDPVLNPETVSVQTRVKRAIDVAESDIAQEVDPDDEMSDSNFELTWETTGGVLVGAYKNESCGYDWVYMITPHGVTET